MTSAPEICTVASVLRERQHRQHFAHRDLARIDRGAHAAAVLEGDGRALIGDAVEDGIGDQVAHRAFHGAADFAAALDGVGGGADDVAHRFLDRAAEFGDLGEEVLVR